MTEFIKVEFINVNDKKNWHLRAQIILDVVKATETEKKRHVAGP